MPPKGKSARYEFNWELPDQIPLRNPAIPGGKKSKEKEGAGLLDDIGSVLGKVADTAVKVAPAVAAVAPLAAKAFGGKKKGGRMGNSPDTMVPSEHQVKISGGKLIDDGRGNLKETDEALKPISGGAKKRGRPSKKAKEGGGVVGDVLSGVGDVVGLLGLGKEIEGGAANSSFIGVKSPAQRGGIQSGSLPVTTTNPLEQPIFAKGKGASKAKKAATKAHLVKAVSSLESKIKEIKKSMKKI
jgi:hypothetical protein